MTKITMKCVGVLGGLGPAATADFFSKVVMATPAAADQDHLHVIIDNNPKVPNRNEAVAGTGVSPAPVLAEMASRLETAGADFLVMVCNAAHAFQDAITDAVRVPFVSII
jgi:aspartate racemase